MNGVRDRVVVAVAPGTSTDAVGTAFELAAERGISVLAVRAWHDPDVPLGGWLRPHGTAQWDALHQKAREELDRAVEHAKAAHPAVEVEMVVVDDDPVPFLAALSARAELLVLGRPRHPGQLVSPVDALIRQAVCPVLIVPPTRWRSSPPMRILAVSRN
jgi:nucleotide-binding universal stress UspA family protein